MGSEGKLAAQVYEALDKLQAAIQEFRLATLGSAQGVAWRDGKTAPAGDWTEVCAFCHKQRGDHLLLWDQFWCQGVNVISKFQPAQRGFSHGERIDDAPSWIGGNRNIDPSNQDDVKAWQERDRQAAAMLGKAPTPEGKELIMFDPPGADLRNARSMSITREVTVDDARKIAAGYPGLKLEKITTGLDFLEAAKLIREGHVMRRNSKDADPTVRYKYDNGDWFVASGSDSEFEQGMVTLSDMLASDWEVVPE